MLSRIILRRSDPNERKSFIYVRKFVDETPFFSFAAIVSTRDGTEGCNFYILDTMVARSKMSGNRFGVIVVVDLRCSPNLTLRNQRYIVNQIYCMKCNR